uniref:Secreted protein n=1 Tax=Haemonchus contortus TaxID=6289 RepID=A0A912M5S0_HAECO
MVSLFTAVVGLLLLWSNGVVSHSEISPEGTKNLPKKAEAAINTEKRSASESDAAENAYDTMMELPDHRRTKRRIIEKSPKKARAIDLQAEAGNTQMRTGREEPPPDARDPSLSSVDDTGRLFPRSSEEERSKRAAKHRKSRRGRKTRKGKREAQDIADDVPAESNMTASNSTDLLGNGGKALHSKNL